MALTGLSKQALIYSDEPLSHRTVVIFERPGAAAADYNIRTLQSEGKIVFDTVERDPSTNRQRTVRVAKEGPTNFVFTTTAPEIHPETETRHLSIFGDESREQTAAAKKKGAAEYLEPLISHEKYEEEVAIWTTAQSLLQPARVVIPYAEWLADRTPDTPRPHASGLPAFTGLHRDRIPYRKQPGPESEGGPAGGGSRIPSFTETGWRGRPSLCDGGRVGPIPRHNGLDRAAVVEARSEPRMGRRGGRSQRLQGWEVCPGKGNAGPFSRCPQWKSWQRHSQSLYRASPS